MRETFKWAAGKKIHNQINGENEMVKIPNKNGEKMRKNEPSNRIIKTLFIVLLYT